MDGVDTIGYLPRVKFVEIDMDSALRPRDIQARLRAGERVEDVAEAAGVPVERLAAFVAPVMAERDHVAGLAQIHPVRRRGESVSHRNLRNTVADQVALRGQDPSRLSWDAWKIEDRLWRVVVRYSESGGEQVEASFTYDQTGRFSVAENELARELINDTVPPSMEAPPPSGELEDDDLALVRVVQGDFGTDEHADKPASLAKDLSDDSEDAYPGGELAEVNGVYDIVPPKSNLDVLYDMLSSFDEDSVRIYSGLVDPDGAHSPDDALQAAEASIPETSTDTTSQTSGGTRAVAPHPAQTNSEEDVTDPAQPSLLEGEEPTQRVRPQSRRKRASVPSWDEIMFGVPKKNAD